MVRGSSLSSGCCTRPSAEELAASVHVQAGMMHPSASCGSLGGSRDGAGPHLDFGHGHLAGVNGEVAEVASVRLYSTVSNYYARTAIGNIYGLRAVDQRGMRPPRYTTSVSNAAGPQDSIYSSVSSLVTGLFLVKGASVMLEPSVECECLQRGHWRVHVGSLKLALKCQYILPVI